MADNSVVSSDESNLEVLPNSDAADTAHEVVLTRESDAQSELVEETSESSEVAVEESSEQDDAIVLDLVAEEADAGPEPTLDTEPLAEPEREPDLVSATAAVDLGVTTADVWQAWREELTASGSAGSPLSGGLYSAQILDLTHAHPNGMAQLLAGRSTRLSSLLRDPDVFAEAKVRAREIRIAASTLEAERGILGCYLAAGRVQWGNAPDLRRAPVLLRGADVWPRSGSAEDVDIELRDGAVLNAELIRALQSETGTRIDTVEVSALAFGQRGFDPRPVYEWLEATFSQVPGFAIERTLSVATFSAGNGAALVDFDALEDLAMDHVFLGRALQEVSSPDAVPPPEGASTCTDLMPLPPAGIWDQFADLPLDDAMALVPWTLDKQQRRALHEMSCGTSLLIEGPPGSGVTQTLAAAAVHRAVNGGRVVVLNPRRGSAVTFLERVRSVGLDHLVLDLRDGGLDPSATIANLVDRLESALIDTDPDPADLQMGLAGVPREVVAAHHKLAATSHALHRKHQPWNVSVYEAMAAWAEVVGRPDPPTSTVRLPTARLLELDATTHAYTREILRQAAEAGAFSLTRSETRWLDAHIETTEHATAVHHATTAARHEFRTAVELLDRLAKDTGLPRPEQIHQWETLLDMLQELRDLLDVMLPEILERPLGDLLMAFGQGGGEDDIGWSQRRRLRKVAWSLVIPGVHVADVKPYLLQAQSLRERWREIHPTGHIRVPAGLDQASAAVQAFEASLEVLASAFGPHEFQRLRQLPIIDVARRLDDLAADVTGVMGQPRRVRLVQGLKELGLNDFVEDLQRRMVPEHRIPDEFDLIWWSGILEYLVGRDEVLRHYDSTQLRSASAYVGAGERAVRKRAAGRVWAQQAIAIRDAARRYPDEVQWLREHVTGLSQASWQAELFARVPHMVRALAPIAAMSPDVMASCLPNPADDVQGLGAVDLVIIDDAGTVSMSEAVATIARGSQLLVGGDRRGPTHWVPSDRDGLEQKARLIPSVLQAAMVQLPVYPLNSDHRTQDGRLLELLRGHYGQPWYSIPGAWPDPDVRLDVVTEPGTVAPVGEELAISSDAEVLRVVELVAEHAALRPHESLMVVTLGEHHAERVEATLRTASRHRAMLARWLTEQTPTDTREPFVVLPATRALGLERDSVIVTIGLAHSCVASEDAQFGVLDTPLGAGRLVTALSRARIRTTVVSCLDPADVAPHRGRGDGVRLLHDALAAAQEAGDTAPASVQPDALLTDLELRLRAEGIPVRWGMGPENWPIDLALYDPMRPGMMLVAVDMDGVKFPHREVIEREYYRARRWRAAGWLYLRIHAMEVFTDPAAAVGRMKDAWLQALMAREREMIGVSGSTNTGGGPKDRTSSRREPRRAVWNPPSSGYEASDDVAGSSSKDDTDAGWREERAGSSDEQYLRDKPPHWS